MQNHILGQKIRNKGFLLRLLLALLKIISILDYKYALSFYTSYSFDIIDDSVHYTSDFHELLSAFFVDTELTLKTYVSYNKAAKDNCVVVGYPKLDEYLNKEPLDYKKYWKEPDKFK